MIFIPCKPLEKHHCTRYIYEKTDFSDVEWLIQGHAALKRPHPFLLPYEIFQPACADVVFVLEGVRNICLWVSETFWK